MASHAVVPVATLRLRRHFRSRSRGELQRGDPRKGVVAVGAAHGLGGAQAGAERRALRFSEKRAAEVRQQLDARHARGLAVRHAGDGRCDGRRDAAGSA